MLFDLKTHGKINFTTEFTNSENDVDINKGGFGNPYYLCKNTTVPEVVLRKYREHILFRYQRSDVLRKKLRLIAFKLMSGNDINLVFNKERENDIDHSITLRDIIEKVVAEMVVEQDGSTHINVHSKANTELGRMLSTYSTFTIQHPKYGPIHTIEGLWCFLRSGERLDWCLTCPNGEKLNRSKIMEHETMSKEEFQNEIKMAIKLKIDTYKQIKTKLLDSKLPLTMYFINSRGKLRTPPIEWIVAYMSELRTEYRATEQQKSMLERV